MFTSFGRHDFPLCSVTRLIITGRRSVSVLILGKALESLIAPLLISTKVYLRRLFRVVPFIPCFKITSLMFKEGVYHHGTIFGRRDWATFPHRYYFQCGGRFVVLSIPSRLFFFYRLFSWNHAWQLILMYSGDAFSQSVKKKKKTSVFPLLKG